MHLQRWILPLCLMALLLIGPLQAANLLVNGDFETPKVDQKVPAWPGSGSLQGDRLTIAQEGNNHYLALKNTAGDWLAVVQPLTLPLGCRVIQVSGRMYVKAIQAGKENWMTARVAVNWKDKDGKNFKTSDVSPDWRTPTKDWTWFTSVLPVPPGAVSYEVMPSLGECTGEAYFDDLSVISDDLLVNGNFELWNPDGTAVGWGNVGKASGVKLLTEGVNHIFSIENADRARCIGCPQEIPLDPSWRTVEVRGRAHVIKAEQGKAEWQQTRLELTWYDETGKMVTPYPQFPAWGAPTDGWVKFSYTVDIPAKVRKLVVNPVIYNTVGQAEFDDLSVTVARDPDSVADANLPDGWQLYWDKEPVEALSTTRAQICLNGLWKFYPLANNVSRDIPTKGWGYIPVPGSWAASDWDALQTFPYILAQGTGPAWKGLGRYFAADSWNAVNSAWYQRTIKIPADWTDRTILLNFTRVSTDAEVWVNGKDCGRVAWPGGTVDITNAVQPGTTATLNVLVVCSTDKNVETVFMGAATDQVYTQKVKVEVRGIINDVFLASQPRGAIVSDVFVQPSTRKQQLALDVELSNVKTAGPVTLTARCVDEKGQVEKTFQTTIQATAAPTQVVKVNWPWTNPRLWDFDHPNLYTLKLTAEGVGLHDEYAQSFGFREFWIDGRKFFLNGSEVRFRPVSIGNEFDQRFGQIESIMHTISGFQEAGYNIQEFWPWNHYKRGTPAFFGNWFDCADKLGWAVIGPLGSMSEYVGDWGATSAKRAQWEAMTTQDLRQYRNHPSVLMWVHSPNRFGNGDDQDPRMVGNTRRQLQWNDSWAKSAYPAGLAANAFIKRIDPTRPVTTHQGGPVGDVHTVNMYPDTQQLQEQEEWLSDWVKTGDVPFMPVEFGPFPVCDFRRGRMAAGFGSMPFATTNTEYLVTEYLAGMFGDAAYQQESSKQRQMTSHGFVEGQKYKDYWGLVHDPCMDDWLATSAQRVYRSWRTMGSTGGAIAFDSSMWYSRSPKVVTVGPFTPGRRGVYRPTLSGEFYSYQPTKADGLQPRKEFTALLDSVTPTLAWIVGDAHEGDVAAFTAKDHSFTAGQQLRKHIALLNDTRQEQPYHCTWQVVLGGEVIASGKDSGTLKIAQTYFAPVICRLPTTLTANKVEGDISMRTTIGEATHEDHFAFRVFAPVQPAKAQTVAVIDPVGQTTAMLKHLGYQVQPWNGKSAKLVVVGEKALSTKSLLPANLQAYVRQGGRLLICAQQPDWWRQMANFRVGHQVLRQAFCCDTQSPILKGLDDRDLCDWAGQSTLVDPYPYTMAKDMGPTGNPRYGWHWSNRGAVTSAPIEKPHCSSWRPILEADFDLSFSPLMEMEYGKGRVMLCTLDLEDHIMQDSAAAHLAANLFSYACTAPITQKATTTVYMGSDAGEVVLKQLGVHYTRVKQLPDDANLVILDPTAMVDEAACLRIANAGASIFVLPSHKPEGLFGSRLEQVNAFEGSLTIPKWACCRGMSLSNLHVRSPYDTWVLHGGDGVEVSANGLLARKAVGAGQILFCQLDPAALNADVKTYLRFTRWRQTQAISLVLANLGASFIADDTIFAPQSALATTPGKLALDSDWKANFTQRIESNAKRLNDPGMSPVATAAIAENFNDKQWKAYPVTTMWESYGGEWANADGEAVFRKQVLIPKDWAGQDLILNLGIIDDNDQTYFNGKVVGHTDDSNSQHPYSEKRSYRIPANLVHAGTVNTIAVRIFDCLGAGGFTGDSSQMDLHLTNMPVITYFGMYYPDYITEYGISDDPHRYSRW